MNVALRKDSRAKKGQVSPRLTAGTKVTMSIGHQENMGGNLTAPDKGLADTLLINLHECHGGRKRKEEKHVSRMGHCPSRVSVGSLMVPPALGSS